MRSAFALALVLLTAALPPARAAAPRGVKDGAGLFKPPTVEQANKQIDKLADAFGFDLYIETVKELPGLEPETLRSLKGHKADERLVKTAEDRADELHQQTGFAGVYVLVLAQARRVVPCPWPADQGLMWYARSHYLGLLTADLRKALVDEKLSPDDALRIGLHKYEMEVSYYKPAPPAPLPALRALLIVGALVGFWLILTLARREVVGRGQHPPPIYQPAVLGSLFGVPAGHWVNDRLFGLERPAPVSLPAAPPPEEPAAEPGAEGEKTP